METYAQSESIKQLASAMAKAQGAGLKALKSSANPFFKSKYADLESCWEAVRDSLSSNGVSILQFPHAEDGLITVLAHESGEWIRSLMIQPIKDPLDIQKRGAAITYCRRFALMAVVGIAPEDDDGNLANQAPKEQTYQGSSTDKAKLLSSLKERGITDIDQMRQISDACIGKSWPECFSYIRGLTNG